MPAHQGWSFVKRFARNAGHARHASEPPSSTGQEATLREIPVERMVPTSYQARTFTEPDPDRAGLVSSARVRGVLQPLLVAHQEGRYVLMAGERRWRAAWLAGLATVPALVGEFASHRLLAPEVKGARLFRLRLHRAGTV